MDGLNKRQTSFKERGFFIVFNKIKNMDVESLIKKPKPAQESIKIFGDLMESLPNRGGEIKVIPGLDVDRIEVRRAGRPVEIITVQKNGGVK